MQYIIPAIIALLVLLAVVSTVRFNRKPPMTREEFERYEEEKRRNE